MIPWDGGGCGIKLLGKTQKVRRLLTFVQNITENVEKVTSCQTACIGDQDRAITVICVGVRDEILRSTSLRARYAGGKPHIGRIDWSNTHGIVAFGEGRKLVSVALFYGRGWRNVFKLIPKTTSTILTAVINTDADCTSNSHRCAVSQYHQRSPFQRNCQV